MFNIPHCKRHNASGYLTIQWRTNQLSTCVFQHRHFSLRLFSSPAAIRRCNSAEKMFQRPVPPTPCHSHSTESTKTIICVCVHWRKNHFGARRDYRLCCRLHCDYGSKRIEIVVVVTLSRSVSSIHSIRTEHRWLHQQMLIRFHFSPA